MNRFKNALKFSIDRIQDAVAVAPISACYRQTPTMSSLFANNLAKEGRRTSKYFNPHRFVAPALAAVLALGLAIVCESRNVAADTLSCGINEITFTTGGLNSAPAISSDGTRMAFESSRDLTGENADGNNEIFLFDTTENKFTQITHTDLGSNGSITLSISGDGKRIAVSSDRDFTGENADGNAELFLF